MKPFLQFASLLLIFLLTACQSGTQQQGAETSKSTEEFAEFAKEEAFKKSHETPTVLQNFKFEGEKIKFSTPDDIGIGHGYQLTAEPASKDYIFVIHEWYGINENILGEATRHFNELQKKVNVIVLDLYDGKTTDDPEEAGKLMKAAKIERCQAIIEGGIAHAGEKARIGTIGWCFGGGWSLQTALAAKEQGHACVIYYGMPEMQADKLAQLNAEVLGIFAKDDRWITPKVVEEFNAVMKAVGKPIQTHSFDADHAFANPSGQRYNEAAAKEANQLVDEFLRNKFL